MNRRNFLRLTTLAYTAAFLACAPMVAATESTDTFRNPPDSARPGVYWYFMDGNLDCEEMVKDLESMKEVGITRTKPFHLEITDAIKPGHNRLEITVVNSWQNRLIGDRDKTKDKRYTQTNIKIRDDWKLRESGLLGPVEIRCETP
jgi:hypothetical protein